MLGVSEHRAMAQTNRTQVHSRGIIIAWLKTYGDRETRTRDNSVGLTQTHTDIRIRTQTNAQNHRATDKGITQTLCLFVHFPYACICACGHGLSQETV